MNINVIIVYHVILSLSSLYYINSSYINSSYINSNYDNSNIIKNNKFEGQTVKYIYFTNKQVYVIYNSSRLPIWNADTFNDLKFDWYKIIPLPRYVLDDFPLGNKLDMYDNSNDYYLQNRDSIISTYMNRSSSNHVVDYSDNMLNPTTDEMDKPETLIIIVGKYRTFGQTCIG